MGDNKDRINVYPSRLALQNMKQRLNASMKGASLLKKRADALAFHYRASAGKALRILLETTLCMKQARITIAEAQFIGGNQNLQILESVGIASRVSLTTHFDNIAGVRLLIFNQAIDAEAADKTNLVGLGRGAEQLAFCRHAFKHALDLIIQQAIVRYAMKAIDNMYDTTNRRVNGIENVVVPRLERTVRYIISELDEEEREEYFRRKKVQVKKRRERAVRAEQTTNEAQAGVKIQRQRVGTMAATPTEVLRVRDQARRSSVAPIPNQAAAISTPDSIPPMEPDIVLKSARSMDLVISHSKSRQLPPQLALSKSKEISPEQPPKAASEIRLPEELPVIEEGVEPPVESENNPPSNPVPENTEAPPFEPKENDSPG